MPEQKPAYDFTERLHMEQAQKLAAYSSLNRFARRGEIVLAGSSLMEQFPIGEFLMNDASPLCVYNRGIGGYVSAQLLENVQPLILELAPRRLFINIGTNDLTLPGDAVGEMIANYRAILQHVRLQCPACRIFLMAYYPVVNPAGRFRTPAGLPVRRQEVVDEANRRVQLLAEEFGARYVNYNAPLCDADGYLREELAVDPIHMLPEAYHLVYEQMKRDFV